MTSPLFINGRTTHGGSRPCGVSALLVAILWISGSLDSPAQAQKAPAGEPDRQSLRDAGLDPNPLVADSFGLKVNLPAGASVVAQRANGRLVISVSDDPNAPSWTMTIQTLASSLEQPSPSAQIDDLLREFKATNQPYTVLSNAGFAAGPTHGQLCYLERPANDNRSSISGWLVLPTGDKSFLVFAVQTLAEHFARLRPILDASFATIELRSAAELASERKVHLDAGRAFIDSVTPEKLKALAGISQWFRIYTPATSDGKPTGERGYSKLEVLEGKRGALTPSRDEKDYNKGEKKPGLLIRTQGRLVVNAERGVYYDSIALYWMAWDQSEEAWSIRGTQRQGEAEQSEAETGVRTPYTPGSLPPRLQIIKSDNTTNSREPFDWEVPDVYLSQPLHWLIGRLLPKDVTEDQQLRYYFYNNFANATPQVSQRLDVWCPLNDGSGNFRLTTRLTSEAQPITSTYNRQGELVRRVHADGSVTEPTTVETVHRLWKNQGLLVGKSSR